MFLSDKGPAPTLETLDFTIRIGSTPTFSYFDLYLYSTYAAHYIYYVKTAVSKELSYRKVLFEYFSDIFHRIFYILIRLRCFYMYIFIEQFPRCFNLEFLNSFLKSCVTKTNNVKIKKNDSVRNMLLNIFRLQKLTKLPMMLINASESLQVGRLRRTLKP